MTKSAENVEIKFDKGRWYRRGEFEQQYSSKQNSTGRRQKFINGMESPVVENFE